MDQCPEPGSPTSEAQAWHPARAPRPCQPLSQVHGEFLAFWEVWGLLPVFSRCSVGVVPHVDVVLMYLWGGRWSPCLTSLPSWRRPLWMPPSLLSPSSRLLESTMHPVSASSPVPHSSPLAGGKVGWRGSWAPADQGKPVYVFSLSFFFLWSYDTELEMYQSGTAMAAPLRRHSQRLMSWLQCVHQRKSAVMSWEQLYAVSFLKQNTIVAQCSISLRCLSAWATYDHHGWSRGFRRYERRLL